MKPPRLQALLIITAALSCSISKAATIQFDLQGTGGLGLLNTNEPGSPAGGTGGEIGAGITFNDVTLQLTVNVGWGSGNSFTDLSSNANNSHVHGPTTNNNGNGFTETAGVFFTLTRTSDSPSSGTIANNLVPFTAAQQAQLYAGKFYINVHTVNNGGGEIRGFLVQAAPEPSTFGLAAIGALGLMARRNRRGV